MTVKKGNCPGDYWQIDFAELPWQKGSRYLLVPIDTFSRWPEVSPCCTNKAGKDFGEENYPEVWSVSGNVTSQKFTSLLK